MKYYARWTRDRDNSSWSRAARQNEENTIKLSIRKVSITEVTITDIVKALVKTLVNSVTPLSHAETLQFFINYFKK